MWADAQRDGRPANRWHPLRKFRNSIPNFFPIADTRLSCEDIARRSCAMVATFLRPVFSASCMQHISDLRSKFALGPHHVWKYGRHPMSDG